MDIQINGPRIWFEIPLGDSLSIPITDTVVSSFVVTVVLCILCVVLGRGLTKRPGRRQVIVEKVVTMLYNMVEDTMGAHNMKFAPYIGALFASSIMGTLISTTGVFRSSTADLSTTATWALMTTFIVWGSNIKENGFLGWLKGFTEPVVVMTPMNIISEIANPVSMAFRHFGNVVGGSVLTTLIYYALSVVSSFVLGWIPNAFIASIPIFQVGIPAVLSLYFDFFSGAIQALVFCMLSMVYIGAANPPHPEKEESGKE
jgi:F-type H+-transporting ATPase subunit a